MVTLKQMQEQVKIAEELEALATKSIETMDLAILGEYGEMFAHHISWNHLPKDFEKTENMQLASKLYVSHMEEADEAYYKRI